MASSIFSHDSAAISSGPNITAHNHPTYKVSSRTPIQPIPYGCNDQRDAKNNRELAKESSFYTISAYFSQAETDVDEEDTETSLEGTTCCESHVTDDSNTTQIKSCGLEPPELDRDKTTRFMEPGEGFAMQDISARDNLIDGTDILGGDTGSASIPENGYAITPRKNWIGFDECAPKSVGEALGRFDVDFEVASTSRPVPRGGSSREGEPIYKIDQRVGALSREKLETVCRAYGLLAALPLGMDCCIQTKCPPLEDDLRESSRVIINSILKMIPEAFSGRPPRIMCCVPRLPIDIANVSALRFGLGGKITIYLLKDNEPIPFVCCDETFPWPEWAEEVAGAFIKGAERWAKAGLRFKRVERDEPAHFRIAFALFPVDFDYSCLAEAFLPGTERPEKRTLWVYLLSFQPGCRPYMAGCMAHESGHIGGARHGFDEHLVSGVEIAEYRTVKMGPDNPRSVMNYYKHMGDLAIQESDIDDMNRMLKHTGDEYEGYKIIRVVPEVQVYPRMTSFAWVVGQLLKADG